MITVKMDSKGCVKYLNNVAGKQIPFAMMNTVNTLAYAVQVAESKATEQYLDRPTPFTRNAYTVIRANKGRIIASVRAKQIQNEYLKYAVFGGSKAPKGPANIIPVNQRLNQYGNIARGALRRSKGKSGVFSGVAGRSKTAGMWQRMKRGGLKLLVAYEGPVQYGKRLPFEEIAVKTVGQMLHVVSPKQLADALASGR